MTTVLVTGPIGGGKSTVCSYLASAGMPVYDCDSRCKALYTEVPGLKERELGIPFPELRRVFDAPEKLSKLESIVYPLLLKDLEAWKHAQSGPLAFVESAIALEKPGFRHVWDKVLMVTAPASLRLMRNPQAALRDTYQHYDNSLVDYTIDNDSDLESLFAKVDKYLESL